jgi:hypothetical protein
MPQERNSHQALGSDDLLCYDLFVHIALNDLVVQAIECQLKTV